MGLLYKDYRSFCVLYKCIGFIEESQDCYLLTSDSTKQRGVQRKFPVKYIHFLWIKSADPRGKRQPGVHCHLTVIGYGNILWLNAENFEISGY